MSVSDLSKAYGREGVRWLPGAGRGPQVRALTEVSLSLSQGETLALVGESGCGKTTLGKILSGLEEASAGSAAVDGTEVAQVAVERRPLALRRAIQMVFQDPEAAFNPSHTIGFTLRRALRRLGSGRAVGEEVDRLLTAVGLSPAFAGRLPRNLSGGEKQRAALARALAGQPRLLIADEPVSALDVSVQAAILNLLQEIQGEGGMALLFISHDLAVVRHLADRVAVMYLGRIVESGPAERVFAPPYHPYTEALLSAAPTPDPDAVGTRILLEGPPPSALEIPAGCPFHPRCPRKIGPLCEKEPPPEVAAGAGHTIRCHIPLEELRAIEPVIGAKSA